MSSGSTTNYLFPYPLSTDPVRVASDIEELAVKIDTILKEEVEDTSAAMWSGGTFSNGLSAPTYNDSTGKMSMSLSQDLQSTASPQFVGLTLTGDIEVRGGDLTTNQTTFNILNTVATTLNIGGSATTINIGNTAGKINSASDINIANGKNFKINDVDILSSTALGSSVVSSSLTSVGNISSGTWSATTISLQYGGTGSSLTATNGGVVYSTDTGLAISSVGSAGEVLTSSGSGAPTWSTLPGSTEITISGDASGTGTSSIELTLSNSGVLADTYGSATSIPVISVYSKGRITSASNQSIDIDPLPQILMMAGM